MKKLLALITIFMLSFVLLACGDNDTTPPPADNGTTTPPPGDDTPPPPPPSAEGNEAFTGEFLIWLDDEEVAEVMLPILSAQFPNVHFMWDLMGNVEMLTNLSLDGPAGIGPDIVFFPHDHIFRAINDQLVLPLGPELSEMMEGRFHDAAVASVFDHETGWHFGIPIITESVALFYNRDLLNRYGFEVATTWERMVEQVQYMNESNTISPDGPLGTLAFRFDPGNAYDMHFALTAHGFQLFGPDHTNPDLINFDTPEVIAGLEWLYSNRTAMLNVPNDDLDGTNRYGAFIDGEVAYIIDGPWRIGDIMLHGDFDFGVTMIPTINGNRPITFSGNIVMAASAFPGADAALRRAVLGFLASDEGLQIQYDTRGRIPALIDGSAITGLLDNEHHVGILAQANYSHPMPIIPEMSFFWGQAGGMMASVWDRVQSAPEAAAAAQLGYESARAIAEQ